LKCAGFIELFGDVVQTVLKVRYTVTFGESFKQRTLHQDNPEKHSGGFGSNVVHKPGGVLAVSKLKLSEA
jgi:hypothetical protein